MQLFNYVPKGRFFASDITENDTIEGNEKKLNCVSEDKKRGIRGKKAIGALLVLILASLKIVLNEKTDLRLTEDVAVTFSKIQLDIHYLQSY